MTRYLLLLTTLFSSFAMADMQQDIDAIETQMIEWRRHIHQNPELSNREFKTAAYVTKHLQSLGLEVKTDIAFTGVVGAVFLLALTFSAHRMAFGFVS